MIVPKISTSETITSRRVLEIDHGTRFLLNRESGNITLKETMKKDLAIYSNLAKSFGNSIRFQPFVSIFRSVLRPTRR
jgi:hypothetical protein